MGGAASGLGPLGSHGVGALSAVRGIGRTNLQHRATVAAPLGVKLRRRLHTMTGLTFAPEAAHAIEYSIGDVEELEWVTLQAALVTQAVLQVQCKREREGPGDAAWWG